MYQLEGHSQMTLKTRRILSNKNSFRPAQKIMQNGAEKVKDGEKFFRRNQQ